MKNGRKHGETPYSVVVVHGGPGAAGEMAPVAQDLAHDWGVLEPHHTAISVKSQVEELTSFLKSYADPPVTLIGFSWGAWLGYLLAAMEKSLVKKLILIGSPPFEERYVAKVQDTRRSRLSDQEKAEIEHLFSVLDDPEGRDKSAALARIGALTSKAETFNAIQETPDALDCKAEIFLGVWDEAAALRRSGQLLGYGQKIECPVVAFHGDYDPHPAQGVKKPLSNAVADFEFILLRHCGHKPWIENEARDGFFRALRTKIGQTSI